MFRPILQSGRGVAGRLSKLFSSESPQIPRLSFAEIKKELTKSETFLLDVREKDELITDGRISSSQNIPLGEISEAMQMEDKPFKQRYGFDKPDADKVNLVIHCKAGVRAMKAAVVANQLGYSNVKVYNGILDWLENGGSLIK